MLCLFIIKDVQVLSAIPTRCAHGRGREGVARHASSSVYSVSLWVGCSRQAKLAYEQPRLVEMPGKK